MRPYVEFLKTKIKRKIPFTAIQKISIDFEERSIYYEYLCNKRPAFYVADLDEFEEWSKNRLLQMMVEQISYF